MRIDCGVRGRLVLNVVGVVKDVTAAVTFDQNAGPCSWDVTADGAWSITAK